MIICKGYKSGNPCDGEEYECGYDTEIDCGDCICNGGDMSPQTGKKFRGNPEPYIEEAKKRWQTHLDTSEVIDWS